MAHPDDVDFSAAGTVATWTDAGIEVTYLMVTDGDAGGFDDDHLANAGRNSVASCEPTHGYDRLAVEKGGARGCPTALRAPARRHGGGCLRSGFQVGAAAGGGRQRHPA